MLKFLLYFWSNAYRPQPFEHHNKQVREVEAIFKFRAICVPGAQNQS